MAYTRRWLSFFYCLSLYSANESPITQEHGLQPEFDEPVGAAATFLVLAGRGCEDVFGEGQGRGGVPELHSDIGEPGAGSIADLRHQLIPADVSAVPSRRAELHRGVGEERSSGVPVRPET